MGSGGESIDDEMVVLPSTGNGHKYAHCRVEGVQRATSEAVGSPRGTINRLFAGVRRNCCLFKVHKMQGRGTTDLGI